MHRLLVIVALVAWPMAAQAQDRAATLADIRAELTQLGSELSGLRAELMTTGAVARPGGSTMLERMESLELELVRLNSRAEDLELRINRIVADGTNRLGDLEFRVTELEGGDPSALSTTAPLGGDKSAAAVPALPKPQTAVGEQADFDRAREVLGQGDFRTAEGLLAAHATAWPNGPLTGEVLFLRGEALDGLGDTAAAARSYLDSFSGYPDGPRAPEALVRLGRALGRLGQAHEACLTLGEVGLRYPGDPAEALAQDERAALSCP
ncbi:tol-pal system protein YbgF [Gemmobacter megaterium]|uniref:Cell division coordinator CpoB n=1 Tax=Gemmobacter megaterium TaxID=1086013 RepID=A0A1N7P7T7_9RHOB|nr:tol-pal system protein YbgF [Gemmobacter megaterium]GGE20012.1 tol-pal system protein YbgF [Gemmobacter megaterium]SIT06596.1 tol-pal system protein YbgF [Gemmobacter megaterium]